MDYKLKFPRDWVTPDANKSDFDNHRDIFYNYIPKNELPDVQIVGVTPINTNTKKCCRWQVVFEYVHNDPIGAFKFVKDCLNENPPRNARPNSTDLIREQPPPTRYMVTSCNVNIKNWIFETRLTTPKRLMVILLKLKNEINYTDDSDGSVFQRRQKKWLACY